MRKVVLSVFLFSAAFSLIRAQSSFYSVDTIQKIEIFFSEPDWDYIMDTANIGADTYLAADSVKINGNLFFDAGVKYKGNSSYDSARRKNPLHIELNTWVSNANYQGYKDIKLSNGFKDPSSIREVLAYEIVRNYMAAPLSNFAQVYINNEYYGLYTNSESISSDFLSNHFYSSANSFFKCNPVSVVSGQYPNLLYLGTDSANYYSRYEMKSDTKWKDLLDLCDTLCNVSAHIDSILDVDRTLWMLAFNNVTVNLDSYTGAFAQNYYLYRDDNGRFDPIVWDLNMCFGGFTSTGTGNLSITQMQQMSPLLHFTNGARPLIMNLLSNATCKKMYIAHMRTLNNEFFSNGNYLTRAQALQTIIDTAVQSEQYSLYTYAQFQSSLNTTVATVPGLSVLMGARATYLDGTTDFQQSTPVISSVSTYPSLVNVNDSIWISCSVSNATAVFLGTRDQHYKQFRRYAMFDDGLHNDGVAGDGIYGVSITATSAVIDYYIYAENSNAGIFSPERAEYEYYNVMVNVPVPAAGSIVINEFLSSNTGFGADETGSYEDWIELYNNTSASIPLLGLYLSDNTADLQKFALPNAVLAPNSYLIIWADEDDGTTSAIHANFKLSASGEKIFLSTASGNIIDSVTYASQVSNISVQRCPNGTGNFTSATPTFNYENCTVGISEAFANDNPILVYPSPSASFIYLATKQAGNLSGEIFTYDGKRAAVFNYLENSKAIDVSALPTGIYFIQLRNDSGELTGTAKFTIVR